MIDYIYSKITKLTSSKKILILIALLALLTRLYLITDKDLWYDEVLDISQSQKPIQTIFKEVGLTPTHYLIVHFFTLVSPNILFLRMPSVIFGVLSVVLLFFTIKKVSNDKVALFSALLLAISPMTIEFSQQILHYSFFIFFSILSLYFYFDLIFNKNYSLKNIVYFIISTLLNLTTHLSALLVLQCQIIFFITHSLFNLKRTIGKVSRLLNNKRNIYLLLICSLIAVGLLIKMKYLHVYLAYSRFDINSAIPLGYSLTSQLKTGVLRDFNFEFFKAMFAWFGNGGGYQLVIYFSLFALGILWLIWNNFWLLTFALTWIISPFFLLKISGTSHWFEEKYFIFIIPVYLFVISYGVINNINFLFRTVKSKFIHNFFTFLVAFSFIFLSIEPLNNRTTYGFKIQGNESYNWNNAINGIQRKMDSGGVLMTSDDKFLKVYLGNKNRNRIWISEEDLIHYTPQQYQQLVSSNNHYYISIPDVYDMRIGKIITAKELGKAGGFNMYKIEFLKNTPIEFYDKYIENFMKMDYLKDAANWSNVLMSYNAEVNIPYPQTEEANLIYLVPKYKRKSFIVYSFKLKESLSKLLLRVNFIARHNNDLTIEIKSNTKSKILDTSIFARKHSDYVDTIYDVSEFGVDELITIKFIFNYPVSKKFDNQLAVGLKSFGLFTSEYSNPQLIQNADGSYLYDAELEVGKNKKWWIETISNFGWVQTNLGILYRLTGTKDDSLIYRFNLPPNINKGDLHVESFTKDNTFFTSISSDGITYKQIDENFNELIEAEHNYNITENYLINQNYLYVKFQTAHEGKFAALRAFKLKLK